VGTGVGMGVCWLSCVDWLAGVVGTSVGGARERHDEAEKNFCSVTTRGCEVLGLVQFAGSLQDPRRSCKQL
jgi:hypothetical protein